MVKMINFMLYIFNHNKNKNKKKSILPIIYIETFFSILERGTGAKESFPLPATNPALHTEANWHRNTEEFTDQN